MNIDQIQSILGAEIECGVFESVVVPALDICRKAAASSAATVSDAARVALTDERIIDIWCNTPTTRFGGEVEDQEIIDFARALLAASQVATTAGTQRLETTSEHIARDIREGRFPQRSEPQMVSAASSATAPLTSDSDASQTLPQHAMPAWRDVVRERRRQIGVEGWTPEHDDEHTESEMALAAACYAMAAGGYAKGQTPPIWPWSLSWWKPAYGRRDLVKAGALILAEIERIDRAQSTNGEQS